MHKSEAFRLMGASEFGSADTMFDRYRPRLRGDGSVAMAPEDGTNPLALPLREVDHWISTLEDDGDLGALLNAHGSMDLVCYEKNVTLTLTDARIIFVVDKVKKPDERMVGHVRYPWIETIAWHPNRGITARPRIFLMMSEDFPVGHLGSWDHKIELAFPKEFHPGALALELAKRVCAHNLAHGAPECAHDALRAMLEIESLDDPPENDMGWLDVPANVDCPLGARYIGDSPKRARWRAVGANGPIAEAIEVAEPTVCDPETAAFSPDEADGTPELSQGVRDALVASVAAADGHGHRAVRTDHILISLLADEDSRLARLLAASGASFDRVVERFVELSERQLRS